MSNLPCPKKGRLRRNMQNINFLNLSFYKGFYSRIVNSVILHFISIKYFAFFIQIINSVFIAKYLGVFAFGIYSFIALVLQYLNYTNVGIYFSLNTILSVKKKNNHFSTILWETSLGLTVAISFILLLLGIVFAIIKFELFEKYSFSQYSLLVFSIAILYNFNILFANLFRVYGKLKQINFYEIIGPILILFAIIYFNNNVKVVHILLAFLFKNVFSLIVFVYYSPLPVRFRLKSKLKWILIKRGFNLLLYNLSYVFILISARTVVSVFYTVEDLANFTLANSFANSLILVVGVFSFIFYPKLINKFSHLKKNEEIDLLIKKLQLVYVTGINFISLLSILTIPILVIILPDYNRMIDLFKVLIICQIFINSSYGYSIYLIANGREGLLTKVGFFAILTVVIIGSIMAHLGISLEMFSLSIIAGSFAYSFVIIYLVRKQLNKKSIFEFSEFSFKSIVPLIIIFISVLVHSNTILPVFAFVVYLILNYSQLINVGKIALPIVLKKDSFHF